MSFEIIGMFRHIVGNNVAHAALYHHGRSDRTPEDIREIQKSVIKDLETQINARSINDSKALEILRALQESDWSDNQSYLSFRSLYNAYVKPVEEEAIRERNKIFMKG